MLRGGLVRQQATWMFCSSVSSEELIQTAQVEVGVSVHRFIGFCTHVDSPSDGRQQAMTRYSALPSFSLVFAINSDYLLLIRTLM
jgi:hypothetical protein